MNSFQTLRLSYHKKEPNSKAGKFYISEFRKVSRRRPAAVGAHDGGLRFKRTAAFALREWRVWYLSSFLSECMFMNAAHHLFNWCQGPRRRRSHITASHRPECRAALWRRWVQRIKIQGFSRRGQRRSVSQCHRFNFKPSLHPGGKDKRSTLIVYWLSNVLKFLNYSDCFRVTRNLGGDGFAQSRSLFGEGTKEEEQRAREGNAATQADKPAAGFVPMTPMISHVSVTPKRCIWS